MNPDLLTESIDISRLNRAERRNIMKGGKMGYMIRGRNMPFVKKQHGEITSFYGLRDKEIEEENKQRQAQERMRQGMDHNLAHIASTDSAIAKADSA